MTTPNEQRLYGNWRAAKGFGVGNLGASQTITVFLCILIPVLALYLAGPASAAVLILIALMIIGATVIRVGGSTALEVVMRRVRFATAKASGYTELTGGVLTDHPRRADLPGPMAPLVPLDVEDGRGGRQALLWDRRSGRLTVVIRVSPVGVDLADQSDADAWVANWGAFLAGLGYEPMVRHVQVTVDTAPTGGTTVRDYVANRMDRDAPQISRQIMAELVDATPTTSADVDTRISVTFDPSKSRNRPRDLLEATSEVIRWLPSIESILGASGVAVLGRASAGWLAGRLRIAYDPASRGDVARLRENELTELLTWEEAGPVRAVESWDHWRHDSGISVAWAMYEAPRQAVMSRVLTPLLAPGRWPRRVTLFYAPFPAEQTANEVEQEIANNRIREAWAKRSKRDQTQRDIDDQLRARQAAREEAAGAGVGRFGLYVSTTVLDMENLPSAIADVEQRAGQSKVRLRRLRGAHSAGFAGALGLGIDPVELSHRARR